MLTVVLNPANPPRPTPESDLEVGVGLVSKELK